MGELREDRRYVAILVMDVVGYSHMVESDELGTVRAVRRLRDEVILPALSKHGGRMVKTMGDGFLAEFSVADAAFSSATEIQRACVELSKDVPAKQRLILRMGAHLGDVIVDEEDILGDGVNIAARLEGLAPPGGVAASTSFIRALRSDLAALLSESGQHSVKNISRPLSIWHWSPEDYQPRPGAVESPTRPPTIAVLSFGDQAADSDQAYFAEGLAEDIVTGLQHMGRLPVVAAASSLALDPELSLEDASRLLGARYIVKGTVRRAGERVRVTVELVEGDTGHSLWSDKYDRSFEDVFEIQDDITLRVVTALDVELVEGEIDRLRQKRPEKLGAWERYLRGMSHLRNADIDGLKRAQVEFLSATEMAPDYGEAWAGLAWAYLKEYGFGLSEDPAAALEKGYEAAKNGVALAGKSPFAHYSLSTAYVWRGEKELSLKELEHAIQLNPYFTRAKIAYHNRRELSDPTVGLEAAEEIRKALALSPREPDRGFYFWSIARINLVANELLDALDWADRAVSVRPSDPNMVYRRAICLAALDRVSEARQALDVCEALSPGSRKRLRSWRPYEDEKRNKRVFAGFFRHNLEGW